MSAAHWAKWPELSFSTVAACQCASAFFAPSFHYERNQCKSSKNFDILVTKCISINVEEETMRLVNVRVLTHLENDKDMVSQSANLEAISQ